MAKRQRSTHDPQSIPGPPGPPGTRGADGQVGRRGTHSHRLRASRSLRKRTDRELSRIARECFEWAQEVEEPTRIVTTQAAAGRPVSRRVIGTEEDARRSLTAWFADPHNPIKARSARLVVRLLSDGVQLKSRVSKADNTRHWAIWCMMTRLLEWSEFDPTKQCNGVCTRPPDAPRTWHCQSEQDNDPARTVCAIPRNCAKSIVFPYATPHSAATAVVTGFAAAGLDSKLTVDRVLKHYQRHFNTR
jgi:hypothetical protein